MTKTRYNASLKVSKSYVGVGQHADDSLAKDAGGMTQPMHRGTALHNCYFLTMLRMSAWRTGVESREPPADRFGEAIRQLRLQNLSARPAQHAAQPADFH